jgi:hypothetical protein
LNLVFAFAGSSVFRHLEGVVLRLLEQGHHLTIVTTLDDGSAHPNVDSRALLAAREEHAGLRLEDWMLRTGASRKWTSISRELLNYSTFYRRGHPSVALRGRWRKYLPEKVWRVASSHLAGAALASPPGRGLLRLVEAMTQPVASIVGWLRDTKADGVIACPFILPGSLELEYVKAAKSLGVPTMVAVQSWDNLTTKGTFSVMPDKVFVWNEALRREAIELHDLPTESITVTGSPTFDYWFEIKPTLDRALFARQCGIDPARPYVVYLCSSRGMIEEEKRYVADLAQQMRENPATAAATLLVRPHPLNILDWSDVISDQVKVWPPRGEFTDNPAARRNFFHTLHYCAATVGVNTSAMLEAGVADRPCITVIDERYSSAQSGMGHFRHLLEGGFLQVARSYEEAGGYIGEILAGRDTLAKERRRFVERFVRPRGLSLSASSAMAEAIVACAGRRVSAPTSLRESP